MNRYQDYDNFAWLYNQEWAAFAENIFPALKDIAGEKLPDGASVLDLCCGTGQLAKVLIEKGYKVSGLDGSAEMIKFARKNAPTAKFIVDDARTFKQPPVYDAVFSTFDALNHVMTLEELLKVFKNANRCLVKGGIFIFDMTTKKHFEANMKSVNIVREQPGYLFTVRGNYDEEKKIGEFHCTVFQSKGRSWKRSDIILHQTWYPCEDVKSALKNAGFTGITAHTFNLQHERVKVTEDTFRVFFYAQKP